MKAYHADIVTHLQARTGTARAVIFRVAGRNLQTGLVETFDFWTGTDILDFTIEGEIRTCIGAQTMVAMPAIQREIGIRDRTIRIGLSPIAATVANILKGYDVRTHAADLHECYFQPGGGPLIGTPHRLLKGIVSGLSVTDPPPGGEARAELALTSVSTFLTRGLPTRKSDAALQARAPGDGFRRYVATSGSVSTPWGTNRA